MLQYFFGKVNSKSWSLLKSFFSFRGDLQKANNLIAACRFDDAITELNRYLKKDPHNCSVFLAMAHCYEQLGQKKRSSELTALAYAVDDTYIPTIYRRANSLIEENQSEQALPLLGLIKDDFEMAGGVNSLLSAISMNRGDAFSAKEFQLSAWLGDFDNLRNANCYLFRLAYNDSEELLLAQEHQFWGQTLARKKDQNLVAHDIQRNIKIDSKNLLSIEKKKNYNIKKIKIGYWGSDFREHSVRYFSRPLISNHNTDRFDIYIYNDNLPSLLDDKQTKAFRSLNAEFFDVNKNTDEEVESLILSHHLDVLVDLTGHTSANRLPIWRDPLAKIKITGLAYPPTTGLSSINYKIMDKHIYTDDASSFYCENPLVLPQSLWCFDPMEDIEYFQEPPAVKNKFFTFGCFGNVAKITSKILTCWSEILNRVPDCHLLIQSTTLVDEATKSAFELKLINHNIPQERLQLRGPTFGGDFWATYREIDIVLDTYPFNGGTTSCFAAYAGVPVLTIAGKSLISRVGKSIMSNMGYSQFVVEDYESYIEKAVEFADSLILISQFRKDARKNFKATSLGDGKKFATDFEEACETILNKIKVSTIISTAHVPPLPKEILLNRAKTVWYYGNTDAADRILSCCLKSYPSCGGAFILKARKFLRDGDLNKAINLIKDHFDDYSDVEAHEAMLLVAHIYLLQDNFEEAANSLERQRQLRNPLPMHEWEAQLLWLACGRSETVSDRILATPEGEHHLLVCIPSPDAAGFEALKNHLTTHCICPKGWTVAYLRCDPEKRLDAYNDALTACEADTLILLQRNLKIHNPDFYIDTVVALQSCDVLGCAGANRWAQKDWALDLPQYRAWGLIRPSSEAAQMYELQVAGTDRRKIVTDAAVLDGKFLALKPATFSGIEFDTDLSDVQWLAEEDWSNRVHEAGYALHIHRNLGIMLGETLSTRPLHTTQGQERLINRLKLDPLAITVRDFTTLYIPVKTPENGYQIANCFFV